jgi:hypothetical protein
MASTALAPAAAASTAKVKKAISTPGAKGAKGFLLWASAALPPQLVKPIVAAAAKHVPSTSPGVGAFGSFRFLGRSAAQFKKHPGMRGFGQTGFTGGTGGGTGVMYAGGATTPAGSTGATSATIAASPSTAGSSAWANDILGAVTAAGAAATTITAIKANLTAAQQGLAPVAYVPGTTGAAVVTAPPIFGIPSTLFWMLAIGGGALLLLDSNHKHRG